MKYLNYILFTLIIVSCSIKPKEEIQGDLTFQSINFMSLYGVSNEVYDNFLVVMHSKIRDNNFENEEERKLYVYFNILEGFDLLRSPCIFLNTNKDKVLPVYLNIEEYEKIKDYSYIDLFDEHEKVKLVLEFEKLKDSILFSDKIISIKKVKGKTRSNINGK